MKRPKITVPKIFSQAGRGGPRRLLLIGAGTVAVVGIVAYASIDHKPTLPASSTVNTPGFDPLPGGMNSTPEQERLAAMTDREGAAKATHDGTSFTPQMASGRPTDAATTGEVGVDPSAGAKDQQGLHVEPVPLPKPVQTDQHFARADTGSVRQIAVTPQDLAPYKQAADTLVSSWGARPPRTVEEIPPPKDEAAAAPQSTYDPPRPTQVASVSAASARSNEQTESRVLVPAGRGIYAHTIVAVDSDSGGPIVLEADSGPVAGDRMIGSFGKASGHEDLLVVQVTKIVHDGKEISADGLVLAPATMQTAVATSVDQHYVSRFLLPAAAAFVEGLGSAFATTSNTVGQIGPLGNTNYVTKLNLPQQIGVGAGVAAQQVASALQQQAPTGPTIHLAAHANVGVMFLSDVKLTDKD